MNFLPSTAMAKAVADYARRYYHIKAPAGVAVADLLRGSFWSHHVARFDIGDLIDVLADDGSFDIQLRVIAIDPVLRTVRMRLRMVAPDLMPMVEEAPERTAPVPTGIPMSIPTPGESDMFPGFKIDFAPKQRWRVIRRGDGAMLKKDIVSKAEAEAWVTANMSEIAA